MKNIKFKVVLWIMLLFGVVGSCIANDSIPPWGETLPETTVVSFKLEPFEPLVIEADPFEFTLKSEPLKDNAPLQSMLECQNEQTDALNENLSALNRTADEFLTYKQNERQFTLNKYNIVPDYIQKDYTMWTIVGYALSLTYVVGMYAVFRSRKYLYWSRKKISTFLLHTGIGLFVIYGFIKIMHLTISGYYLWMNMDKLF